MAETFYLKVVASDRQFYEGPCEMITFIGVDGSYGILPHHECMVTPLEAGELTLKINGVKKEAAVGEGFVEILPNQVTVLTDFCEWADEIDVRRAEEAKQRAEERLRQKQSIIEYHSSKAALSRAMARLKVTRKMR
ncbi:MAG TPA: ATP synthase F1 subunit epsilon [Candidatus Coprocola pullicola]|nr:ATP synthase F1 subunit epsilon [Candidatus Coprocola pullicola]